MWIKCNFRKRKRFIYFKKGPRELYWDEFCWDPISGLKFAESKFLGQILLRQNFWVEFAETKFPDGILVGPNFWVEYYTETKFLGRTLLKPNFWDEFCSKFFWRQIFMELFEMYQCIAEQHCSQLAVNALNMHAVHRLFGIVNYIYPSFCIKELTKP